MTSTEPPNAPPLSSTGVSGLDDVLGGGLTPYRLYLVEGNPGSGKTTLALQYLLEGLRRRERGVYVTLSETEHELRAIAASHGWSLDGLEIVELVAGEQELEPDNQYTMFQPAEVQLGETTRTILAQVERVRAKRVVIDSLSELRLLAQSPLRYRRQILALKQFFTGRECTVLLLDDRTSEADDLQLQSIAHGVISLEHLSPEYGAERRRLRVMKLRGQRFRGGFHDFNLATGGLEVFPRLVAAEHAELRERSALRGDVAGLDEMLGGGIELGTSSLLVGPAGSGKSSVAISYAVSAANQGMRAALFIFDERFEVLIRRAEGLGLDLRPHLDSGLLTIQQVDPAELSPGELGHIVRAAVEGTDGRPPARVIVIDSLNGYLHAMPEERFLTVQLHELLTFLGHKGVATFLVLAQHGMIGQMQSPIDTTYLADTVILFRYFEAAGLIRQAISVVKKRSGKHERAIRELRLDGRIVVGEPLTGFQGVLTGTPVYKGESGMLMGSNDA
ncbi:Circadian clock protein kinase KaiC [Aquisphaera giovannonii]|uniref:non-specific serine/threonine protein kinase n=1 Tax=Aquisphaera giovannonii TaxID=406548 RepID=A0A5B9W609_9BACT|nr:ATPase domain-containing protein [Aquisphaera giovannonii]QEH35767.1 Circadian clock protein kinase KaiC [Aquisphaera giovannonii]